MGHLPALFIGGDQSLQMDQHLGLLWFCQEHLYSKDLQSIG
jgi:hypothetical protein